MSQQKSFKKWWKNVTGSRATKGLFNIDLVDSIVYAGVPVHYMVDGKQRCQGYIPTVVSKCGWFLKERGISTTGIFRVSGSAKRVAELQAVFDTPPYYGSQLDWTGYTNHDAANVLRRFLNCLPDPVINHEYYEKFRDVHRKMHGEEEMITAYQDLISKLPPPHSCLLMYLLDFLSLFAFHSDENLMDSKNLASVFQPGILSHPSHEMSPGEYLTSAAVLKFLIDHQSSFTLPQPNLEDEEDEMDVRVISLAQDPVDLSGSLANSSRGFGYGSSAPSNFGYGQAQGQGHDQGQGQFIHSPNYGHGPGAGYEYSHEQQQFQQQQQYQHLQHQQQHAQYYQPPPPSIMAPQTEQFNFNRHSYSQNNNTRQMHEPVLPVNVGKAQMDQELTDAGIKRRLSFHRQGTSESSQYHNNQQPHTPMRSKSTSSTTSNSSRFSGNFAKRNSSIRNSFRQSRDISQDPRYQQPHPDEPYQPEDPQLPAVPRGPLKSDGQKREPSIIYQTVEIHFPAPIVTPQESDALIQSTQQQQQQIYQSIQSPPAQQQLQQRLSQPPVAHVLIPDPPTDHMRPSRGANRNSTSSSRGNGPIQRSKSHQGLYNEPLAEHPAPALPNSTYDLRSGMSGDQSEISERQRKYKSHDLKDATPYIPGQRRRRPTMESTGQSSSSSLQQRSYAPFPDDLEPPRRQYSSRGNSRSNSPASNRPPSPSGSSISTLRADHDEQWSQLMAQASLSSSSRSADHEVGMVSRGYSNRNRSPSGASSISAGGTAAASRRQPKAAAQHQHTYSNHSDSSVPVHLQSNSVGGARSRSNSKNTSPMSSPSSSPLPGAMPTTSSSSTRPNFSSPLHQQQPITERERPGRHGLLHSDSSPLLPSERDQSYHQQISSSSRRRHDPASMHETSFSRRQLQQQQQQQQHDDQPFLHNPQHSLDLNSSEPLSNSLSTSRSAPSTPVPPPMSTLRQGRLLREKSRDREQSREKSRDSGRHQNHMGHDGRSSPGGANYLQQPGSGHLPERSRTLPMPSTTTNGSKNNTHHHHQQQQQHHYQQQQQQQPLPQNMLSPGSLTNSPSFSPTTLSSSPSSKSSSPVMGLSGNNSSKDGHLAAPRTVGGGARASPYAQEMTRPMVHVKDGQEYI